MLLSRSGHVKVCSGNGRAYIPERMRFAVFCQTPDPQALDRGYASAAVLRSKSYQSLFILALRFVLDTRTGEHTCIEHGNGILAFGSFKQLHLVIARSLDDFIRSLSCHEIFDGNHIGRLRLLGNVFELIVRDFAGSLGKAVHVCQ